MMDDKLILVIDDDPLLLETVADIVRVGGYRYLTAKNGVEGLRVLQQHTPDLIICDIMMPKMDGYQFYDAVRSSPGWQAVPFIFLTAKGEKKDVRLGYELGADLYVTKPFEPEDLLVAIQSRLRRVEEIQAAAYDSVEKTKQQLIKVFSHELRTPLTIIYSYLSMLREDDSDIPAQQQADILQAMWTSTERLVQLVEDLMLIVYIDSGAAEVEIESTSMSFQVAYEAQNAIKKLSQRAQKREITLHLEIDVGLVVYAIPTYVYAVIYRLLDNAIKFGQPGGNAWIRGYQEGDWVHIIVEDDGIGIAEEDMSKLFKQFSQIKRDIMEQQGTGIGLALSQRLVSLHGGEITLRSVVSEGTRVEFTLPCGNEADDPI